MRRSDVLIVGGGPAGSTCARRLRERGFDVVLLDQARFPRDKPCAGWITPPVLHLLGIDPAGYAATHVLQPITGFRVSCGDRPDVRVDFGRVVSYGIRRCEFDHHLLQRCGAEVHEGTRIDQIERDSRDWVVNGAFASPMLVGAGGHFCPVARTLGARIAQESSVIAQEAEWPHQALNNPAEPALRFFDDRSGYGWCFQKQHYANIGLGRLGPGSLAPFRQEFMGSLRRLGALQEEPPAWHGHAYLTAETSRRRVCDDGVLLIGDSAGLADPRSGEGIRPAVESALLAADCISQTRGDYARIRLAPYAKTLGARRSSRAHTWTVPRFVSNGLMSTPLFVREVVVRRWFLHLHEGPMELRR